jgi:acetyl-CoA carboxylase biotin carboxyl carrier protein
MARGRTRPETSEQAVVALVRRLGAALHELGLGEIEVAWGDVRVRVQRPGAPAHGAPPASGAPDAAPAPVVTDVVPSSSVSVESPMVGTFYRAPSPNADPYVREGDVVKEGQIVCVIEAMKLMNEIEAKVGGRIAKILVENGHAVEYGQPLFLIEPAR